ncbi:hypothetical protein SBA4_3690005 [Candidatus Sulfopaludibacter sp. SbA4]|nr:hypothetical protein SBA4_3690005 [Candidatus Sulfopaludibacter sp. SbA4]
MWTCQAGIVGGGRIPHLADYLDLYLPAPAGLPDTDRLAPGNNCEGTDIRSRGTTQAGPKKVQGASGALYDVGCCFHGGTS